MLNNWITSILETSYNCKARQINVYVSDFQSYKITLLHFIQLNMNLTALFYFVDTNPQDLKLLNINY
jgi:hypothetical protein